MTRPTIRPTIRLWGAALTIAAIGCTSHRPPSVLTADTHTFKVVVQRPCLLHGAPELCTYNRTVTARSWKWVRDPAVPPELAWTCVEFDAEPHEIGFCGTNIAVQ